MKYTEEIKERVKQLTEEGDSVELICKKIGISRDCFYRWRKTKKDFADLIDEAKRAFLKAIGEKLEASLFKRATGFEFTETETEYVNDGNGQPVVKNQKTKNKYYPPETGALIFALTNLAPERWKNRQRVENEEITEREEIDNRQFENLPEELQDRIADYLQDREHEKIKQERGQ